jgi:hypothetical protein
LLTCKFNQQQCLDGCENLLLLGLFFFKNIYYYKLDYDLCSEAREGNTKNVTAFSHSQKGWARASASYVDSPFFDCLSCQRITFPYLPELSHPGQVTTHEPQVF